MEKGERRLPPLTNLEKKAVEAARQGKSACSTHLADLGIIDPDQIGQVHDALKRVAKRVGVYEPDRWIGRVGKLIYGQPRNQT